MKQMKKLLLSTAVAAVMAGTGVAAHATTTALGTAAIGVPLAFNGTVAAAGGFIDEFTFTLPANGGSGYSVLNFPLTLPAQLGGGTFNVQLTTLALYSDPDGTPYTPDDVLLRSVAGGPNSLSLTWGPTLGGKMFLQVMGSANGTVGGLYNGAISVSPIPEPETWAMMLVGAGLVGFQLRRRMKQTDTLRLV